jgi:hypothetical protein
MYLAAAGIGFLGDGDQDERSGLTTAAGSDPLRPGTAMLPARRTLRNADHGLGKVA